MNIIFLISFISCGGRFLLFKFGDYNKAKIVVLINQSLKEEYDIYLSSSNKTYSEGTLLWQTDKESLINEIKNECIPINIGIEEYIAYSTISPVNLAKFTDNFIFFSPKNTSLINIITKVEITKPLVFSMYEEIGLLINENTLKPDNLENVVKSKIPEHSIETTNEIISSDQLINRLPRRNLH